MADKKKEVQITEAVFFGKNPRGAKAVVGHEDLKKRKNLPDEIAKRKAKK